MVQRCRVLRHLASLGSLLAVACGGVPDTAPDAGAPDAAIRDYRAEVVRELVFEDAGRRFPVQLVRIGRPDGATTYVQWIRSDVPGPRPAVLETDPYGGIDWSGEEVDARWARRAPGSYPDDDGPGGAGARLSYQLVSPQAANEAARPHLLNGLSTVRVFGRFYAGGSARDDIEDMKAGMWFLAEQPDVDRTRIGTFGGSWGGFESLYASAQGDRRVAPRVTVAMFPLHDLAAWTRFVLTRAEPVRSLIDGHLQRVHAATGGADGDFTGWSTAELCSGLPADTLVLHDELDNLVPLSQSEHLLETCGADHVYWRRGTAADPGDATHGPLLAEPTFPSIYTFAYAYLHLRLVASGSVLGFVAPAALRAYLATVRAAQQRNAPIDGVAARLRELCTARLTVIDVESGVTVTGATVVAAAVNAIWGTAYTAATIDAALATGVPPP
ncbi:MAG: prolyl oligopeptidase family serine peptidase [Myxococcota bacterium]|nr:prolyl oligopeptidase family serine peptidase [Myxococcota bacterium]